MKNKLFIILVICSIPLTLALTIIAGKVFSGPLHIDTDTVAVKKVAQDIVASGSIHSENEVTLHFQTGGKLIFLPFQKGDAVTVGQTIAQLDTYALQKTLQLQANAYAIAKNNSDQTQENKQATILEGQTRTTLDQTNKNAYSNITEAQVITDTVQRLVDNSLLTQNSAQLQVDLANYALSLSSLTAPFTGIITSEDVTTANVNVTPATGFSLADPNVKVFRADVAPSDIDFVSVGDSVVIKLDGEKKEIHGTVEKISPQKITFPSGESVYEVDIRADDLNTTTVFGQNGSVVIKSNSESNALLAPSWAVLGHNTIWVWNGKSAQLKTIQTGATHDNMTEVTSGLSPEDKIILAPQAIAKMKYNIL